MASGVMKKLTAEDRSYYTAGDVMAIMDVSRDKAYTMIREMRQTLIDNGSLAKVYPQGRVPKKYFNQMCMIE